MTAASIFYIAIVPTLAVVLIFLQSEKILDRLTFKSISFILVAVAIMGFAINDGCDKYYSQEKYDRDISNLKDSLKTVKDTLINIGLGIDEKTGRILVMDSLLLKKEFTNVFNVTQVTNPDKISDAGNFVATTRKDTLYLYPKKGNWLHGYVAFDTSSGETVMERVNENYGTSSTFENHRIPVNNKTFTTHIIRIHDRAVWKNSPIRVFLSGYNKYIIFGDEGVMGRRWIYQAGKVTWIPED